MAISSYPKPPLNGIALCAGYGGLELGLHITEPNYRTVCYVEREAHAAAALVARMEDAALDRAPIWDDLKTFNGRPWRGRVHIVSAGYPCQPFSAAGKRQGAADPRHLWPHVKRIAREVRPEWVFLENVQGHLDLGFPEVGQELRRLGFGVKAMLVSAFEVGASHERTRLFVLAHADRFAKRQPGRAAGTRRRAQVRYPKGPGGKTQEREDGRPDMDLAMAASGGGGLPGESGKAQALPLYAHAPGDLAAWHLALRAHPNLQPAVFGVVDGMADRLDRDRGAGNGVSPLAAAFAYRALKADFRVRGGMNGKR